MAAVMITDQPATLPAHRGGTRHDRSHLRLVATAPAPRVRPAAPRASAATFRRRRLVALLGVVAVVFMVGKAGAALGGESLATPGRAPSVTRYVVQPGDTLWSAAHRLSPDSDPREVIDALSKVRGTGPLQPGEVLRWQQG
jgi:nucleoid-associated protein YgaU